MFRFVARAAVASLVGVAVLPGSALATNVPPAQDVRQFACPPAQVQNAGFDDIAGSAFALEINCMAAYGITTGVTPSSYAPGREVLRAQMAQFIARLATEHAGLQLDTSDAGFTDIAGLSPAARDAVNGLANAGIVNGTTPTTYGPAGQVQRGQMASFLARLQDQLGGPFLAGEDFFADDDGSTHEDSINRIAAAGIVNGTGDRAYSPSDPVTRQQMSAFLMRYVADRVQTGEIRSIYPSAETARAPLAAQTVISGSASGKVPVRLDQPATFTVPRGGQPGSLQVTGEGRFAGFALVADGTDLERVMISGGRVSTGLPADHELGDSLPLALSHTDALPLGGDSWELPAGDYHLYLIADGGSPVTVTLSLTGLSGSTRLAPAVPVAADVAQPHNRYLDQGTQGGGAPGQLRGPGLLLQVAAGLHDPSLTEQFTNCIYVGELRTTNATYGPGCPDANVGLRTGVSNVDPRGRSLILHVAGAHSEVADTYGQGYSAINAGVNDHLDFRSLWLTF